MQAVVWKAQILLVRLVIYFKFWEKNVENQISFKAKNTGKGP